MRLMVALMLGPIRMLVRVVAVFALILGLMGGAILAIVVAGSAVTTIGGAGGTVAAVVLTAAAIVGALLLGPVVRWLAR